MIEAPAGQDAASVRRRGAELLAIARRLSVVDWLLLTYLTILVLALAHGSGPSRKLCLERTSVLLAIHLATLVMLRGGFARNGTAVPTIYRWVSYGTVQVSYFWLRDILPTVAPHSFDEQLYRLDVRLFGVEPTVWADRFVSSATTEWFAFFYFGYFFLLSANHSVVSGVT